MQAIILAGGRGERLMPLTADRPKCLVDVAGHPLIDHQLRWLAANGVDQVVVSCGYRWERIREAVGDGGAYGLRVHYAVEDTPLGRGGGIRKALDELKGFPRPPQRERARERAPAVVACNGDVLTALPLAGMLRHHRRTQAMATLLLVPFVSQHGIVELGEADRVEGFKEKPVLPYWLSGGVYVLSPAIEKLLPRLGDHETTTWPRLAKSGKMAGYRYRGFWQSVDSVKDVGLAEAALRRRMPTSSL
ncbi:MAG TPA: nucleotidyltransferase family protein [Chloroflexota bacterium]|nr:nucleotidyltransferase family protein [Chloroflexota bacterium]